MPRIRIVEFRPEPMKCAHCGSGGIWLEFIREYRVFNGPYDTVGSFYSCRRCGHETGFVQDEWFGTEDRGGKPEDRCVTDMEDQINFEREYRVSRALERQYPAGAENVDWGGLYMNAEIDMADDARSDNDQAEPV